MDLDEKEQRRRKGSETIHSAKFGRIETKQVAMSELFLGQNSKSWQRRQSQNASCNRGNKNHVYQINQERTTEDKLEVHRGK